MRRLLLALCLASCGRIDFDDVALDAASDTVDGAVGAPRWTWMGGSRLSRQFGVYGQLGMTSPSNIPGGRDNGGSWAFLDELWLFGGHAYGETGNDLKANDLWRYSLTTGEWTWMHGSKVPGTIGVYGTPDVPSATTTPSARNDAAAITQVGDQQLWLFGGIGYATDGLGYLSDVWMYDMPSGQWTWVDGPDRVDQLAVYNTEDVPSPANHPGARGAVAVWQTGSTMMIYGGLGIGTGGPVAFLADVWVWSTVNREWVWVGGTQTRNAQPVYGDRGVANASNTPGGRVNPCAGSRGAEFWMFGGKSSGSELRDDVWRLVYQFDTTTWTWMSGSTTPNAAPVRGTLGVPDPANTPGARLSMACWMDDAGNLWVFGGESPNSESYADLWKYDTSAGLWTWVAGPAGTAQRGTYGTVGVADPSNAPGSRSQGGNWFSLRDGALWLFGGDYGIDDNGNLGAMNDLWRFGTE